MVLSLSFLFCIQWWRWRCRHSSSWVGPWFSLRRVDVCSRVCFWTGQCLRYWVPGFVLSKPQGSCIERILVSRESQIIKEQLAIWWVDVELISLGWFPLRECSWTQGEHGWVSELYQVVSRGWAVCCWSSGWPSSARWAAPCRSSWQGGTCQRLAQSVLDDSNPLFNCTNSFMVLR